MTVRSFVSLLDRLDATLPARVRLLVFPLAALLNSFSTTLLLLIFGLVGLPEIAADIALTQAASLALFYAFSANARNLVLADPRNEGAGTAGALLAVRAVLMLPLAVATYIFGVVIGGGATSVALVLIARRMAEWIGEIALARHERLEQSRHGFVYLFAEAVTLTLVIVLSIGLSADLAISAAPWVMAPLLTIHGAGLSFSGRGIQFRTLLPHLGSTAIIGASVYVFRLSIALLAGKAAAGVFFTAFALGGLIPTLFGQALAPTLMRRYGPGNRWPSTFFIVPATMLVIGGVLTIGALMNPGWNSVARLPEPFLVAVGMSICGGAVMSVATLLRARLIHGDDGREVFGPDLLANVLLTSCIPFAFHAFGAGSFSALYLFSACLSLFFLSGAGHRRGLAARYHGVTLPVLGVGLVLPVFFQLDGGLFRDSAFVFDAGGSLLQLPLPLSMLAVFCGIALLGNYRSAGRTLTALFFSTILFVMTALISAKGDSAYEGAKLALLAQYLLPMFGLVLGEMYGATTREPYFERSASWVLVIVLPLQLLATWLQGYVLLSPKIFFFSIYQHLQYFPMIVSAISMLAVISLWARSGGSSIGVAVLMLISSIYIVAANSFGALVGLSIAWLGFAALHCRKAELRYRAATLLAISISGALLFAVATTSGWLSRTVSKTVDPPAQMSWASKLAGMMTRTSDGGGQPVPGHVDYWRFYAREILESPRTLMVGHPTPPDRKQYPSAHNYWLDVGYNFGLLAVLPVLGMFFWTIRMLWSKRAAMLDDPMLFAAGLAFLYLFVVENSLKVGLRQPYPGILSYFIWGLLIARICASPRLPATPVSSAPSCDRGDVQ